MRTDGRRLAAERMEKDEAAGFTTLEAMSKII
jgi:hypothetical protein